MKRWIPTLLLPLLLTGCPQPKPPATKSDAVQDAKSTAENATDGAVESGKTVVDRTANTAENAADGAAESGKTVVDRTANTAENAAEGGKSAAHKAGTKASGMLDKALGR